MSSQNPLGSDGADSSDSYHDDSRFSAAPTVSDRLGFTATATLLIILASWMFWIVQTFLKGRAWGDFAARMILTDFIFAIFVFALVLLIYALFAPQWLVRILNRCAKHLSVLIASLSIMFAVTTVVVLLVLPILLHFGVLE